MDYDDIFDVIGKPQGESSDDFADLFQQIQRYSSSSVRELEVTNEGYEDVVERDETSSDDDADEEMDELDHDSDDIFEGIGSFYYLNFRRQIQRYHISQILQYGR
jgi:hypothetical protein